MASTADCENACELIISSIVDTRSVIEDVVRLPSTGPEFEAMLSAIATDLAKQSEEIDELRITFETMHSLHCTDRITNMFQHLNNVLAGVENIGQTMRVYMANIDEITTMSTTIQ